MLTLSSENRPHVVSLTVPRRNRKKAVTWCLYKPEISADDVLWDTIHEIRRIEKYGRDILGNLSGKLGIELNPLSVGPGLAQLLKNLVCSRVCIQRDVKARVVALAAVPKGKEVEFATHYLTEKNRVVLARPDLILPKVALIKNLNIYLNTYFCPLAPKVLGCCAKLPHVAGRE